MTLLEQLRSELPIVAHRQQVYYSGDVAEAERIASRVRELSVKSIVFVMKLDRFELRPPEGHPKREAYDVLVASLAEVTEQLARLPGTSSGPTERDGGQ